MSWIARNTKWIMLALGAITCTMVYAVISPRAALQATFGETLEGPLATILIRHWGAQLTLVGGMLMYGANHSSVRRLVLSVAIVSRLVFISLLLSSGRQLSSQQVGMTTAVESVIVALLIACLVATWRPMGAS